MKLYSEFGEDQWIAENLTLPETGFYIDVGCAFPGEGSNTAFLRDRGWSGYAIDANDGYAPHWKNGHFVQAFVSSEPIVSFVFKNVCGHSRVESTAAQRYAAVPLTHFLRTLPTARFDFLSVDVEGHEFEVVQSLDGLLPPVIVSEFNTEGIGEDMRVRDYLLKNGYRLAHTTVANHIFVRP